MPRLAKTDAPRMLLQADECAPADVANLERRAEEDAGRLLRLGACGESYHVAAGVAGSRVADISTKNQFEYNRFRIFQSIFLC